MELIFKDFSGFALCRFYNNRFSIGFDSLSYTFKTGTYILKGQISDGGWAISYALAPLVKKDVHIFNNELYTSRFYLNGKEVILKELQKISIYLGNHTVNRYAPCNMSGYKQIQKAIKKGTSKYSLDDLITMFCLSQDRIHKPVCHTSGEAWLITAAIGLAMNKQIFCMPWQSNHIVSTKHAMFEIISKNVKRHNGILLIPAETTTFLEGFADEVIDLRSPLSF